MFSYKNIIRYKIKRKAFEITDLDMPIVPKRSTKN